MEHVEKNPGIFEKNPGTFEKHMVPTRTLGEPFVKKQCHWPAKHQHSNQVQSDRLPNVCGDATSGTQKMLKNRICKRHLVKWQVARGSFKKVYLSQIFANVSKNTFFFRKHLLSDFWGMLKTLLI